MDESSSILEEFAEGSVWLRWWDALRSWIDEYLLSFDTLLEVSLIIAAATIAWPIATRIRKRILEYGKNSKRFAQYGRVWNTLGGLAFPVVWLILQWIATIAIAQMDIRKAALLVTSSLLGAWIIVNIASAFVANPFWSRTIAVSAWLVAALNILGLLDVTVAALNDAAFSFANVSISALTIIQGVVALGFLLWITAVAGNLLESSIRSSPNLSPSVQVLATKLLRIGLAAVAFLFALTVVGIDITAFAVLGGAIGVGLGFGLQKIFANLVSGFILLMDKSIKPGDVIAVHDYYGRVDSLGARYVSVSTRDGIEHLIPNEELITSRVENWSHSQNLLRIRKKVGVHYKSDVRRAIALCLEATDEVPRILKEPKPVCHLQDFGDSSVDLEMRFWIDDPMNGRQNVVSDVLLKVWDKFAANGIEIPYPQRDIHLRSSSLGGQKLVDTAGDEAAGSAVSD